MNSDWFVHWVECPNVSTTNSNLQKEKIVYHHLGCKWGYRPLSYLFKPLMLYAYHVLNNLGHTLASALFHVQQPSAVSVGHICLWSSRCSNNQLGSKIYIQSNIFFLKIRQKKLKIKKLNLNFNISILLSNTCTLHINLTLWFTLGIFIKML